MSQPRQLSQFRFEVIFEIPIFLMTSMFVFAASSSATATLSTHGLIGSIIAIYLVYMRSCWESTWNIRIYVCQNAILCSIDENVPILLLLLLLFFNWKQQTNTFNWTKHKEDIHFHARRKKKIGRNVIDNFVLNKV